MSRIKVLSVGQCSMDHGLISHVLDRHFAAEVIDADSHAEALAAIASSSFDLILVNRIGDADGARGLDLIRSIKSDGSLVPVMLVSNYADAQAEAVALGALPGFGKSELGRNQPPEALKAALAAASAAK